MTDERHQPETTPSGRPVRLARRWAPGVKRVGRPPSVIDTEAIVAALVKGHSLTVAAAIAGTSASNLHRRMRRDNRLREAIDIARGRRLQRAEQVVHDLLGDKVAPSTRLEAARLILSRQGREAGWGEGAKSPDEALTLSIGPAIVINLPDGRRQIIDGKENRIIGRRRDVVEQDEIPEAQVVELEPVAKLDPPPAAPPEALRPGPSPNPNHVPKPDPSDADYMADGPVVSGKPSPWLKDPWLN